MAHPLRVPAKPYEGNAMIASNYRRHPEALALQLPLPFGHLLKWALPRPGSRVLRAIRAARAAAFKAAGRIKYPEPKVTPQWVKNAKALARQLSMKIENACLQLALGCSEPTDLIRS